MPLHFTNAKLFLRAAGDTCRMPPSISTSADGPSKPTRPGYD